MTRFPAWFKALKMAHSPAIVSAVQGARIASTAANSKTNFTIWHGVNIQDYQAVLDIIGNTASSTAVTALKLNALKAYMYDHVAIHNFRNNSTNAECELQFYKLIPRTAVPAYVANAGGNLETFPTITPPADFNYNSCARISPTMLKYPYDDEDVSVTGGVKMTSEDINATPYMNPILTSLFKIKKMRVGGSHIVRLQAGGSCSFTVKHTKPKLVNWNKFGIPVMQVANVNSGSRLGQVWEVLPHCPVVLVYLRGTTSHDNTSVGTVGIGTAEIDYVSRRHWRVALPEKGEVNSVTTYQPFTAVANFAATEEQTNIETGALGTETFT